eukprot:scaffold200708_cov32-Tisochrysis_lutea.AAC.7
MTVDACTPFIFIPYPPTMAGSLGAEEGCHGRQQVHVKCELTYLVSKEGAQISVSGCRGGVLVMAIGGEAPV